MVDCWCTRKNTSSRHLGIGRCCALELMRVDSDIYELQCPGRLARHWELVGGHILRPCMFVSSSHYRDLLVSASFYVQVLNWSSYSHQPHCWLLIHLLWKTKFWIGTRGLLLSQW